MHSSTPKVGVSLAQSSAQSWYRPGSGADAIHESAGLPHDRTGIGKAESASLMRL